jgi:hypothetical protein
MKSVRIVLVGFALAALVAACSQKADETSGETEDTTEAAEGADEGAEAAEAGDEATRELEERGMVFMEAIAAAGVENVEDCAAVAASWRTLIDDNEDLLDQMSDVAATQTPEDQAAFEERYSERLGTFMEQMTEVIQACQEHEEILELMEELSTQ